jgi:coenzyme Q-binding protein COQ10
MASIKDSIVIACSPEKVHNYVAWVDKWPAWFAALGSVKGAQGDGAPGTVVEQSYSLLGKDLDFVTTVTESGPVGDGRYVWRADRTGHLPGRHSLEFSPEDGTTLVTSELEYELPGGLLGKAADHLGAKAAIEHSARHTLKTLKELAEEDWFVGLNEKEEVWPRVCDD